MANLFVASSLACALLFLPVTSLMAQLVNLGVLTDVSGIYSTLSGEGSAEAARMAVEDFGGTVLGREVKVFLGDHRANVVTAADIATEWFDNNEVGIILDMPNSTIALGMQKLAADRGKVSVTVSAGSTDLTGKQCRDTAFHWA